MPRERPPDAVDLDQVDADAIHVSVLLQPFRQERDRARIPSGVMPQWSRSSGRNFPVRTSTVFRPTLLAAGDVPVDVVADHPREVGVRVERLERGGEVRSRRLAEHGRLGLGGELQARDECAASSSGPSVVCHQRLRCRQ